MGTGVKALRVLQVGQEADAGTEVAATARILGDVNPQDASEVVIPARDYGVITQHYDLGEDLVNLFTVDLPETELSYEQVLYPLISAWGLVTPAEETVDQDDWVWTWDKTAGLVVAIAPTPKTLTMEYLEVDGAGATVQALVGTYGICRSFSIRAEKGANYALLSANWVAQGPAASGETAKQALPTRTLIPAEKVSIHLATTYAGLGTAKDGTTEPAAAANVNSIELEVTTGQDIKRLLDGSKDFARNKLVPRVATLRVNYDLDAAAEAERASYFRTSARRFIRVKAEGAQLGTGLTRKICVDAPYRLMSWPTPADDEGESTVDVEYTSVYDPTEAQELGVTVVNDVETLP